jgi:hypothetical protein
MSEAKIQKKTKILDWRKEKYCSHLINSDLGIEIGKKKEKF